MVSNGPQCLLSNYIILHYIGSKNLTIKITYSKCDVLSDSSKTAKSIYK